MRTLKEQLPVYNCYKIKGKLQSELFHRCVKNLDRQKSFTYIYLLLDFLLCGFKKCSALISLSNVCKYVSKT